MRRLEASRAYQTASRQRGLREQEADVFRRVNATLRNAEDADPASRSRAVADNHRLWITVVDQLRDPGNALPEPLRASIISIGLAVQRETAREQPDLAFMIGINEHMAAGLTGG